MLLLGCAVAWFVLGMEDGGEGDATAPARGAAEVGTMEESGVGSVRRTSPREPADDSAETPARGASSDEVQLVSRAGATVQGLWLKREGRWTVHRLERPGFAPRALLEGAELVAPVGHLPERVVLDGGTMVFAPWSLLKVVHAPASWVAAATVAAPILPEPSEAWKVLATGTPDGTTWVCALQPTESWLDAPPSLLRTRAFPFELHAGDVVWSAELSLARGAVLEVDFHDLRHDLARRDLPVVLRGPHSSGPWAAEVLTDAAGSPTLSSLDVAGGPNGRLRLDLIERRELHFEGGERGVVPDIVVGTFVTVLARAEDRSWFAFAPRRLVEPDGELVLEPEPGIELTLVGLRKLGDAAGPLHVRWWFQGRDRPGGSPGPVGEVEVPAGRSDSLTLRMAPTLWQAIRLNGRSLDSCAVGVRVALGTRRVTRVLPIPASRRVVFPVEDVTDADLTIPIRAAPEDLASFAWVQFAVEHADDAPHATCRLSAPIDSVEPGEEPGTAVVHVLDEEGSLGLRVRDAGMPALLVLQGPEDDAFFRWNPRGSYEEIPTAMVELDLHTRRPTGEWDVSWAFGCSVNSQYPLAAPVSADSLPRRVSFEVPVHGAFLYVDGDRIGPLRPPGPLALELE